MFWSKIWIFLLAIGAAICLTLALVMPRPAERATLASDKARLKRACGVAEILLRDAARNRIQLAGEFSRAVGLDDVLAAASKGEIVTTETHSTAKTLLQSLTVKGADALARRLDVALLDRKGRVVARSGKRAQDYGDSMAGYFAVEDALDGYLRDDLWTEAGSLYLVAGGPVVTRQFDWAGAVMVRELVDKDLVDELAKQLDAQIGFYVGDEAVAVSSPAPINKEILAQAAELPAGDEGQSCGGRDPFLVDAGEQSYWVHLARLPGEAGTMGAFFAVFAEREADLGFSGTIKAVKKDDLSFGNFPWLAVGGLFVVAVLVGIGFTIVETDRPLRRLGNDAVKLAKGEAERLDEIQHRSKFGSIARSVNIAIDKVQREAKAAKKDLDNLLGPMPDGGGSTAAPLPAGGPRSEPSTPFVPPPPSEFKFKGGAALAPPSHAASEFDLGIPAPPPVAAPSPAPRPAALAAAQNQITPPPITLPPGKRPPLPNVAKTPRPAVAAPATPAPRSTATASFDSREVTGSGLLDDDILGSGRRSGSLSLDDGEHEEDETRVAPGVAEDDADAGYFREVFGEFVALKKQCGESIENLTFAKFSRKLAANRDSLIAKHGCRTVKFQVYVKDGKAALKASPVRG